MVHSTTIKKDIDIETTLWKLGAIGASLLRMSERVDGVVTLEGKDFLGLAIIVHDIHEDLKALMKGGEKDVQSDG